MLDLKMDFMYVVDSSAASQQEGTAPRRKGRPKKRKLPSNDNPQASTDASSNSYEQHNKDRVSLNFRFGVHSAQQAYDQIGSHWT